MGKKIAVHCPTRELWNKVQIKAFSSGKEWSSCGKKMLDFWFDDAEETCINMYTGCLERHNRGYYRGEGYTIISAAGYLKEGEVEEFKVGDKVECVDESDGTIVQKGDVYTITGILDNGKIEISGFKHSSNETMDYRWGAERFKLANSATKTKTKTIKENNMKINSSVRTVFAEEDKAPFDLVEKMQNVFGGEIKEDFTGAMILRNNKEEYLAEIKRLDDIEAKRLKEEAKK